MMNIFKSKKINPNVHKEFIDMGVDEDTASQLTVHYMIEFYKNDADMQALLKPVAETISKNKKLKKTFGLTKK